MNSNIKAKDYIDGKLLNIAEIIEWSEVNGPGKRAVIYLQGCDRYCKGCYNPDLWSFTPKKMMTPQELYLHISEIKKKHNIEGITLSGGEPFLQAHALIEFFKLIRPEGLSVVCFTGFTLDEIKEHTFHNFLDYIDILSAGPFDEKYKKEGMPLRGSTNKVVHLLTNRYQLSDLNEVELAEIHLSEDNLVVTGFVDDNFIKELQQIFNK